MPVPVPGADNSVAVTHADRNRVVLVSRSDVADDVTLFAFARPDGSRLPDWTPGAHIDLVLPDGVVRQYSLCGDRRDPFTYQVAVQREPRGRGASRRLHDEVRLGDVLGFGGPRNNFRLVPAGHYLFIAGGIGITPLLPMIRQAAALQAEWALLYLGRSRSRLSFLDELSVWSDRVTIHCSDEAPRADLLSWRPTDARVRVYACGPTRLLDAVEQWEAPRGGFPAKLERFAAADALLSAPRESFEVTAARSGIGTVVASDESIADALRRVGVNVLTSCAQGVCGTCETGVISGRPDHRDTLLDDAERQVSTCMFPCVSRSKDNHLVLDL